MRTRRSAPATTVTAAAAAATTTTIITAAKTAPRRRKPDPELASPPSSAESSFSDAYLDTSSVEFNTCSDADMKVDILSGRDHGPHMDKEIASVASNSTSDVLSDASDAEPDSEAEAIMKNISRFRQEGPARPRNTDRITALWKRESEFWQRYCNIIQKKTRMSAKDQLIDCDPGVFKSYLFWRKNNFRIKKESAIEAYWERVSVYYHNVTGYAIGNDVLKDVRNWIPSLQLDRNPKEKRAMYVQDLYAILHALWVDDTKPLHGFIRVQISTLLLLSAATATRPGALVESASNRNSNKALCFKDVIVIKVRSVENPRRSTVVANVNLEHVKNKEKGGESKKFTFQIEEIAAFCIISYIIGIGHRQNAFEHGFTNIQQIFDLIIPVERNVLRVKWKEHFLDKPFFCDIEHTAEGARILKDKAFNYQKYRDIFVRLGRVAGFEERLELYQLRRASGSNINSILDPVSRNKTMGHTGDTYERYYTPNHIARDFQAIYFGSPSEEELIRSVARMGLARDRRAPTELSAEQQAQIRNDPMLAALRQPRRVQTATLRSRLLSTLYGRRHSSAQEIRAGEARD
ncbi:hypothetical protein K491DRAFT_723683 [Lophiostoma macrostomum CBS 122681]|uniref:Uncharacterized protein n=1 Tax=Lophiostoma macrostomum CBS 122681 TaxID=1314788 RepID=A0A6A6SKJ9_9PLEO|nr:hypothetical protein K491DRAFT_723683 [Lophiostoma macrostomum CBS 122681]